MIKFRTDFNSCKTVACNNFGVIASPDYIYRSRRLGYLSIECKVCGSNPPWVNNWLVASSLDEKINFHLSRKIGGCPICNHNFFIGGGQESIRHGFTSAGIQRKKCNHCHAVFTLPQDKNRALYQLMIAAISSAKSSHEVIKELGISARLFYFYLNKLAIILSNFSRMLEDKGLVGDDLSLHSEGRVLQLAYQRGFYYLITSHSDSGYVLLQSHNLTKQKLKPEDTYSSKRNSIITSPKEQSITHILASRYQQNMQREHFEKLLVGELHPLSRCSLLFPSTLAYVHFQLLTAFTFRARQYSHYIEHESSLRAAALMASYPEIKQGHASIYYFLPVQDKHEHLQGKKMGWWKDRWFSYGEGAYSPIVGDELAVSDGHVIANDAADEFHHYLQRHLNDKINSLAVLDNISEIHRVIFNYCELKEGKSRANRMALCKQRYTPASLLDAALDLLMVG
ncbi:hypothetical protein [Psychromonas sp. MME1]|uniref:hypothetical protein n=2 Tax=unclassified Psychromonas TaxID=2614957 RepID=UPI0034E19A99